MEIPPDDDSGRSTGFEFTRRDILKTSAVGASAGLAGCNDLLESQGTGGPKTSTQGTSEDAGSLIKEGLELRNAEFVTSESGQRTFLRVTIQNTSSESLGFVALSAEFFNSDLQFLETQNGTITSLSPNEVFEGYLSYVSDDVAAYAVRVDRSSRGTGRGKLTNVSVTDSCLVGDAVELTVQNKNNTPISHLSATVAFQTTSGDILERESLTMTDLPANESVSTAVESSGDRETQSSSIDDYKVTLGRYDGGVLSVR